MFQHEEITRANTRQMQFGRYLPTLHYELYIIYHLDINYLAYHACQGKHIQSEALKVLGIKLSCLKNKYASKI